SAPAVDRYNPDVCIRYDVLFTAQRPSALSLFPYTTLFRSDEPVDVAVGGLGLGYTARAVLEHARVHSLVVIEALGELIDWHEQRLIPAGSTVVSDDRCEFVHADFFALLRDGDGLDPQHPERRFQAILVDIDHS